MIRVNLLPLSYIRSRQARRRRRICVLAGIAVVAMAMAGIAASRRQLDGLARSAQAARDGVAAAQRRGLALEAAMQETRRLRAALTVRDELTDPLRPTSIVSLISRLLPDTVVLTELQIDAPAPVFPAPKKGQASNPPAATLAPAILKPLKLSIKGLAPTDLEVARLVTALSGHALFTNVQPAQCVNVKSAGIVRCGFELTLEIPRTRSFVDVQTEVAHVP